MAITRGRQAESDRQGDTDRKGGHSDFMSSGKNPLPVHLLEGNPAADLWVDKAGTWELGRNKVHGMRRMRQVSS